MRDSETNEGTDAPCENCGGIYYTMGDFSTRCNECDASIADTEMGKVYRSEGRIIHSTPGGTVYEHE